jgi:hypothetical protein
MDKDFYHGRPITFAIALGAMTVFVLIGLAFTCHIAWVCNEWWRMRTWVETPAAIDSVEVKGKTTRGRHTSRLHVKYTYGFDHQTYVGHRVSMFDLSDNFGSFQQDAARELRQFHREGKPFRCFVNPGQPSEAVLYRQLRRELLLFESIFAIAFTFLGGWKLWSIWRVRPWLT